MLNQISQLKLLLSVLFLALVGFQQITTATGHKCFVCLPPRMVNSDMMVIQKMFGSQNLDSIPKCADFNRSKREEFIRDCPKGNNGCLTKFADGTLMRTCTNMSRDACDESDKSGETLCYCKKELCNTPERKLSDPPNVAASQSRREGVARALHSGSSPLNSATSDDEDLTKFGGKKHEGSEGSEGSGDGDNSDDTYYDTTYFGEYDDEDDDDEDGDANAEDSDTAASPGDVDMTEPPPFIVEEDIAKFDSKFDIGGRKTDEKKDKKVDHNVDNDIDFEEGEEAKGRKAASGGGNVHDPSDRKTVHVINAGTVPGSSSALSLLIPHIAFILVAKFVLR